MLAEQRYLHSNGGSRFLCTRIWLFYRKYVYNLESSFCFLHAIYEDIPGCFSDRNSVEDSSKIILLPFIKQMATEFYWEKQVALQASTLELVSKELNHFGVIADLFRQIGSHSGRFVLFCSF